MNIHGQRETKEGLETFIITDDEIIALESQQAQPSDRMQRAKKIRRRPGNK
jgi:hypothetical protein